MPLRRPGRNHLAAAEITAMIEGWQQGMTMGQIAERSGRSLESVRVALDRGGVPSRRPGRQNPLVGREADLARDYVAGDTIRQLMVKYGASDKTIRAALVEQGVTIRPTGSRPGTKPWNAKAVPPDG